MTGPDHIAGVLYKAADLIEERGLAKRTFIASDGARCLVSAISQIAARDCSPYLAAMGLSLGSAFRFNDAPGRTQSEVVSALRNAADEVGRAGA